MPALHIKNTEEFKKEILEHKWIALVDFRAEWCGPCRMLGPIIEQLADKNPNVKVAKVNVDENQQLAGTFQVSSIPVVFVIKNGQVVDKIVGANPPTVYQEKITEHSK